MAVDSNIDFLAISLWNKTELKENFERVFIVNYRLDAPIKLTCLIEGETIDRLRYLADYVWEKYVNYDFYVRLYGKPLLFVYVGSINVTTDMFLLKWDDMRFTTKFVPIDVPYFVDGVQTTFVGDMISVSPGFYHPEKNHYVDRNYGQYYKDQWTFAIAWSKVNFYKTVVVMITSFNEWCETTSIEPSVRWGDFYLNMTKQQSEQFKKLLW